MTTKALATDAPLTTERLKALLQRTRAGDQKAMDQLRPLLDIAPDLWRQLGDMAFQAEQSLINVLAGKDELAKEAMDRKLKALRAELAGDRPTPLERLLVDRIASCWLALAHAEATYHQHLANLTIEQGEYHQRRIDRCQKRYLSAIKALATVRRLQLPVVQVNIGQRQVNVATAPPSTA